VIHVFDGDEAGERATLRALDLCLESGSWGRVLRLPASHDPDSYVRQVGGEAFGKELEGAISLMDYMIQKAVASTDLSRVESKVQALKQVVPRIQRLSDRVAVDHYAAMLADRLRISEARIHELIRGGSPGPAHAASGESRAREGFQQERLLLKAILKEPSLAGSLRGELAKEFQDRNYRALAEMIARWEEEGERWDVRVLEERIHDPDLAGSLAQLQANIGEIGESPERVCEQCMNYLKAMRIGREIHRVKQALTEAEKQGDKEQRTVLELQLKTLLHEKKARLRMSA
jgi:DNA primase